MVAIFKLFYILIRAIFCKKSEYILTFIKEFDGKWYADIPGWPKKYYKNTEMVFGSNRLLEHLSKGQKEVTLKIYPKNSLKERMSNATVTLTLEKSKWNGGAFYEAITPGFCEDIWICPVTLFVLGKYPKRIYIQNMNVIK